jgi:hypothetical protein
VRIFLWSAVLLTCFFLTSCSNSHQKTVKSQAVKPIYNAGQLSPGDTLLKHTFFIKSTGDGDLKIDSVVTSCDCVTINWQKKPIPPGKTGFINVAVKPNFDSKGKTLKYVMVRTNAETPLTIFQIFFSL